MGVKMLITVICDGWGILIVRWHDVKLHLLYRLVRFTGMDAELLDMDAHLRVNAAYAYWCKVRRSFGLS